MSIRFGKASIKTTRPGESGHHYAKTLRLESLARLYSPKVG